MRTPEVLASVIVLACLLGTASQAANLACDMTRYRGQESLTARSDATESVVEWQGDAGQQLRMSIAVETGTPRIRDLAIRAADDSWRSVLRDARPDVTVTSGLRRMSNQQLRPLRDLGVEITQPVLDKYRWDPFWDAPLDLGTEGIGRGNPPPAAGLPGTDQPGMPRSRAEIEMGTAQFNVTACQIRTEGARVAMSFTGLTLGAFSGSLEYTVFRGTNLIRQDVIASTSRAWVAYKYGAGLKGLPVTDASRVRWRDIAGQWQANRLRGAANVEPVPLQASNRLIVAETSPGTSIALFPEPHRFFWAREVAINMGYNWYRKDTDGSYAIGIRQNEKEDPSESPANWALYSARPGTDQHMPVYLYPQLGDAESNIRAALVFTHGDTYKPLPGYQVMNHHYHMDLGERLLEAGSLDRKLPDLMALKALGINIVSQIDSVMLQGFTTTGAPARSAPPPPRSPFEQLAVTEASVKGARIHSDSGFLVLPNQEVFESPLGGHTDLLFSHPVYWDQRKPGQPLEERSEKYGKVYHIGGTEDFMTMVRNENVLISMPHPRTKGSTGFPDAVKDREFFADAHYDGVGMRWGMGLDGSERRLCEFRCWPLLDDLSNWMSAAGLPLKHILSISEVRHMQPGDDIYASQPVSYLKLPTLPTPDDVSPVVKALFAGDSFWTTGEVLVPSWAVTGSGNRRTIVADVEWTFPLEFVEIVWGDGKSTGRKLIPATDLPANSSKRFEIPFDARGQKWVRFAAWDNAGNGAVLQPVLIGKN